jgi:hypothetical protein
LVGPPSPALLTSVSMKLKCLTLASTIDCAPASVSATTAIASPSLAVIDVTVSSTRSFVRAAQITFAPSAANH